MRPGFDGSAGTVAGVVYSELYRVLWRRRLLLLGGTLACVALALLLTSAQEKSFTATATVRVEPVERGSANDNFEASQRLSRSYAEIYAQGAVIAQMAQYMPGQPPPVRTELAAQQLKDLDLLEVSGVSSDPRRAVVIANAGARALEAFSGRERLAPITPASLPDSPSSPNLRLNLLLALVAGAIISAGLALLIDAILQPIADPQDLEKDFDAPVLAVIPRMNLSNGPGVARKTPSPRGSAPSRQPEPSGVGDSGSPRQIGDDGWDPRS